jgi:lysophospholipase L1-like esterase
MNWAEPATATYRSYFRVRQAGRFRWRFWFSNTVDSTFGDGLQAFANKTGGFWHINGAGVAVSPSADGSVAPGTMQRVRFQGSAGRAVMPGEQFWSDAVELQVSPDDYLVFTWSVTVPAAGDALPYSMDSQIPAFVAEGDCAEDVDGRSFSADTNCAKPNLLACDRAVDKRIAFLGDSITQGCGTAMDGYEYWVAKIAAGIGADCAVWNLGLGYARAYDAASDGAWLSKAKKCDEVNICLGVNDIGAGSRTDTQILADLQAIANGLKRNDPLCRIILFTIPPFNYTGEQERYWRAVNRAIRTGMIAGADSVFDMASVLSRPHPDDAMSMFDPHPDAAGGTAIAEAYLAWYRQR